MNSQGDVTDILQKLSTIPAEDVKNEIDNMLPILIISFSLTIMYTVCSV
jgi:hypothetical protein